MNNKIVNIVKDVDIIDYHFKNKFEMKDFEQFPFISFPNGLPCNLGNMFLQSRKIVSLKYESILQKAYNLSHLINFCYKNNIGFKDFKEEDLILFSEHLKNEINIINLSKAKRSNKTINTILKTTLEFFQYIGKEIFMMNQYCEQVFKAQRRKVKINLGNSKKNIEKSGWYHVCFAPNDPVRKRTPISQNQINVLYDAVPKLSKSKYVQQRTLIMLKLLEITGARSGEIAELKILDIENALKEEKLLLRMITLKTKNRMPIERFVPIEKIDLKSIEKFIKIYRSKIIRKTIGKQNDEGYLFISERTGKRLLTVTISNEIKRLKDISGIEGQVCAHMFRHRFITKCFVKLIKQYDLENKDDFRNALLDINSLKTHIQQLTGHINANSLDHYIDLAKDELTNINAVIDKVSISNAYESYDRNENDLLRQLENNEITVEQYSKKIKEMRKERKLYN